MFSLIITIVSIALVAALALATLYFGGSAFEQGSGRANAATVVNQGQQLLGASELFYAEQGAWPASVEELVTSGYLKETPVAQAGVSPALAAQAWTMPVAGQPVFVLRTEAVESCRSVNEKTFGMDGILPRLQAGVLVQCYGADPQLQNMYSVAGRNAEHLLAVARSGLAPFSEADINTGPLPSASDESAWLLKPGAAATGGGSGSTHEPTNPASSGVLSLAVEPAFGNVATNTTAQKMVTLTNTGASALALDMPPSLSNTGLFSLVENTCSSTLAPEASCAITVAYAPTAVSANDSSVLSFGHGDPLVAEEVTFTATAYNPVSLQSATLPTGTKNQPYSVFDFKALLQVSNEGTPSKELASWAVTSGALPAGLALNSSTGLLSGTPTASTKDQSFTVEATYKNNKGQQVYVITVGSTVLEVTQISVGYYHACAVTLSGGVKCWGGNDNGQLGDGTLIAKNRPVDVVGLTSGVSSVAVGGVHTCAITSSGVKCWGADTYGQLGNDVDLVQQLTPVPVSGLTSGVASVSAGWVHTCALTTAGGVKCWGYDLYGQVGNDSASTQQPTPVDVAGLTSGVARIETGGSHSCAVTTAGGAKCWGYDAYGQLGNDAALTQQNTPVDVSGLTSGVSSISLGGHFTCAVTTSAGVKCWGRDSNGQLGNDSALTQQPTPVNVSGLASGVSRVSAGDQHACALLTAGGVRCWGRNDAGQLGTGSAGSDQAVPVVAQVVPSDVVDVNVYGSLSCAIRASKEAICWGSNALGQLGDGSNTNRLTPVNVLP